MKALLARIEFYVIIVLFFVALFGWSLWYRDWERRQMATQIVQAQQILNQITLPAQVAAAFRQAGFSTPNVTPIRRPVATPAPARPAAADADSMQTK